MKWTLMPGVILLGMSVTLGGSALAAGDQHDHQITRSGPPQISAPDVQPSESQSMPALGSAEDMLKAMESMPAHDHDACCRLSKPQPKTDGHNH